MNLSMRLQITFMTKLLTWLENIARTLSRKASILIVLKKLRKMKSC